MWHVSKHLNIYHKTEVQSKLNMNGIYPQKRQFKKKTKKNEGDETNLETAINQTRASRGKLDRFQTHRSQCFRQKTMTYCAAPACLKSPIFNTQPNLNPNLRFLTFICEPVLTTTTYGWRQSWIQVFDKYSCINYVLGIWSACECVCSICEKMIYFFDMSTNHRRRPRGVV